MNEEKVPLEEKRYAVLSKSLIRSFAATIGFEHLPDTITSILSEDVSYRVREIAHNSCQFMRHAKRKRLLVDDINSALVNSDIQPILGHGSGEDFVFNCTKEGAIHFVENKEINLSSLAFKPCVPNNLGEISIKSAWLAVEGTQKSSLTGVSVRPLSESYSKYYSNITQALVGNETELMKIALHDLRTNSNITPLLSHLVTFISNGIKTMKHDISQLTKIIYTVSALISNKFIFLEPAPYLDMLVQAVLYCVMEPLSDSASLSNDHWMLRNYAARLLALIVRIYGNSINKIKEQNVNILKSICHDISRPPCSHYGAIMALLYMGVNEVKIHVIPHLKFFWSHLNSLKESNLSVQDFQSVIDILHVQSALLTSVKFLYLDMANKIQFNDFQNCDENIDQQRSCVFDKSVSLSNNTQATSTPRSRLQTQVKKSEIEELSLHEELNALRLLVSDTFSDTSLFQLPSVLPAPFELYAKRERLDNAINFRDESSFKSGEELLQQFLVTPPPSGQKRSTRARSSVEGEPDDFSDQSLRSSLQSEASSFNEEENADLTVAAAISDPEYGIKITIAKRKKIEVTDSGTDGSDVHLFGIADKTKETSKIKTPQTKGLEEVFPECISPQLQPNIIFTFNFQGMLQQSSSRDLKQRRFTTFINKNSSLPLTCDRLIKLSGKLPPFSKFTPSTFSIPRPLVYSKRYNFHHSASLLTLF